MRRAGARELLVTAVQAEGSEFLAGHVHLLDDKGHQRLVRHGFLLERKVLTGIGKVLVHCPRCETMGQTRMARKSVSTSRLSRPICAKQSLWRNCLSGFAHASPGGYIDCFSECQH